MKRWWLPCSDNRAQHTGAVTPAIRLLETGHSLRCCLHRMVFSSVAFPRCRSPHGIRDDGSYQPQRAGLCPIARRAVRRKGCAVLESVAGCCRHQRWQVPSPAGAPLPVSRFCTPQGTGASSPTLFGCPQQAAAPGSSSGCHSLQPARC